MSLDERFEAFLRTTVPSSSSSGIFLDCLGVEDEGTMILQNVWNHSCNDTAYTFILSEMKTLSNKNMKMKEKCFTESVGMDSQVSDTGA